MLKIDWGIALSDNYDLKAIEKSRKNFLGVRTFYYKQAQEKEKLFFWPEKGESRAQVEKELGDLFYPDLVLFPPLIPSKATTFLFVDRYNNAE